MSAKAAAAASARLFIALWPDPDLQALLATERERWRWADGARPVATSRLHVTLHFIGPVARERLDVVRGGLAVPLRPFRLEFAEHRTWPGGIAVCEPALVPPELSALHASLATALRRLALPVEARRFRPHVTMARAAAASQPPPAMERIAWTVDRYALVESRGGRYDVLATYADAA